MAWLPYFCRSGQRETSLDEFNFEVDRWLPLLPEVHLPRLTGQMLADVVQRKSVTAFDGLARIISLVEDTGVWPDGLLDAYLLRSLRLMVMLHSLVSGPLVCLFGLMDYWMLILP